MTLSKAVKSYKGERSYTYTERLTSTGKVQIAGNEKQKVELNLTSVRFVNTNEGATVLQPMLYLVDPETDSVDIGVEHRFFPPMDVPQGKAFREHGTQDAPLIAIPPGWSLWVEALAGEMNAFVTISREYK